MVLAGGVLGRSKPNLLQGGPLITMFLGFRCTAALLTGLGSVTSYWLQGLRGSSFILKRAPPGFTYGRTSYHNG